MVATLIVRDETADGRTAHEWRLDLPAERLTVRELLCNRVSCEAQEYNLRRPHTFRGLVQPPTDEHTPREARRRSSREIDGQKQVEVALGAFDAGRLLILIGDAQAESLDDEFEVRPGTTVTFLRLTLLVGG